MEWWGFGGKKLELEATKRKYLSHSWELSDQASKDKDISRSKGQRVCNILVVVGVDVKLTVITVH